MQHQIYEKLHPSLKSDKKSKSRIFIIPTAIGLLFGCLTLLILLFAATIQNESIYIFTFILITLGLLGMVMTNFNMRKLNFVESFPDWIYKGQKSILRLKLESKSNVPHIGVLSSVHLNNGKTLYGYSDVFDLERGELTLELKSDTRGIVEIDQIRVGSLYPIGMFFAWIQKKSNRKICVVPQPVNHFADQKKLNSEESQSENEELSNQTSKKGTDEFREHRQYNQGDKISRIDWKVTAKLQKTFVRTYDSYDPEIKSKIICFKDFEHLGTEKALEQMSYLLSQRARERLMFGIELGEFQSQISIGVEHYHFCLKKLATFEKEA